MNASLAFARSALAFAAAATMATVVGCAAPATVEGVFGGEEFRLDSNSPLSKPTGSGRDMVIMLSQVDGETLSTVTVLLPDFAALPIGTPVAVGTGAYGDDRPSLQAAVGALLVEARPDGVEIISATDAVVAETVGGTFTLDEATDEQIAGSFRVDLDDGGFLEGTFVALPAS